MDDRKKQEEEQLKFDLVVDRLKSRGVSLEDIAQITFDLQKPYIKDLKFETVMDHIRRVIVKREVQHAVITGLELDILAEQNKLSEPLQTILMTDFGLYGIDEILALSITNVYGSIGFTNFGYVDKVKPGIMRLLDEKSENKTRCNTFLDDLVGAIAAAAAGSLAHKYAPNDHIIAAYKASK